MIDTVRISPETWDKGNINALAAFADAELARSAERITALLSLPENWNGPDYRAPHKKAVLAAYTWTFALFEEVIQSGGEFFAAHAAASADGEPMLEWWRGTKKLTVYFAPDADGGVHAEYLKSWGGDIQSEMEDGTADTASKRTALWNWLFQ